MNGPVIVVRARDTEVFGPFTATVSRGHMKITSFKYWRECPRLGLHI